MNEIYADKLAITTDYITHKRPPDLFKDDAAILDALKAQEDDTDEAGPGFAKHRHRGSDVEGRSPRQRNGSSKGTGKRPSRGSSGSGKQSADGEQKESMVIPPPSKLLLAGQSSSFATMETDEVLEIRDVTQLFS